MIDYLNISAAGLTAHYTNSRALFNVTLRAFPSLYPIFCQIMKSKTSKEQINFAYLLGGPKEWIGERQMEAYAHEDFEIKAHKYEYTVAISRDQIDDDQLGMVPGMIQELAMGMKRYQDELVAEFLIDHLDHTAIYPLGFDGKYLFADDHAWTTGYTVAQDNLVTTILTAANVEATLTAARLAMGQFRRPDGRLLGVRPNLLLTAPNQTDIARRALESDIMLLAATESAGGGAAVVERGEKNIAKTWGIRVQEHPLLDPGMWILIDTKWSTKPVIFLDRRPIEFASQTTQASDDVFLEEEYKFGVSWRGYVGAGMWFTCYGSDGTA
jgi:phage major head subunit gpT-like protein